MDNNDAITIAKKYIESVNKQYKVQTPFFLDRLPKTQTMLIVISTLPWCLTRLMI